MTTKRLLTLVAGGMVLAALVLVAIGLRMLRSSHARSMRDRAAAEASPEPRTGEIADARWTRPDSPAGSRTPPRGGSTRLEAHLSPWPAGSTANVMFELREVSDGGVVAVGSATTSRGRIFLEGVPDGRFTLRIRACEVGTGAAPAAVAAAAPTASVAVDLRQFGTLVVEGCGFHDDGTILALGEGQVHRIDLAHKSSSSLETSWEWRQGDAVHVDLEPGRWEVIGVNSAGAFAAGPFDVSAGQRHTVAPDPSTVVVVEVVGAGGDSGEFVSIVGADGAPRRLVSLGPGRQHVVSSSGKTSVTAGERLLVRSERGLRLRADAWSGEVALPESGTLRWEMP